jgi:ACR3 family arsenite efflux pump ArsB
MFTVNIGLIILGIAIPIGMVIFWSRLAKILETHLESKSHGMILNENLSYKVIEWMYHHKSKFNIFMIFLVSIIEFLALIPF